MTALRHPVITALTGCPQAEALLRGVAANPGAPFVTGIVGPGGCGKTTVLGELAHTCTRAGVPVGGLESAGEVIDDPGRKVLLVDDAHQIEAPGLELIRSLATTPGVRLAVAYRPWPRRPALSALVRVRPPVMLGYLHRRHVVERARALLGVTPTPAVLDWLWTRTAGMPRLVDRMLVALQDGGDLEQPASHCEAGLVEQLRYDLDQLDPGVLRLLLAMAVGVGRDSDLLCRVLDAAPSTVSDLLAGAQAGGLLSADGTVPPLVREAILESTPIDQRTGMHWRLVESRFRRGEPVLAEIAPLLENTAGRARAAGTAEGGAAAVFTAAGDEALADGHESAALATELYAAAVRAGAPAAHLAARRAEAAALTGELDDALRLADQAIADPTAPDRARAVMAAAAVLAHRGLLGRSAELYRWLGSAKLGFDAPIAAVALFGIGELERARRVLDELDGRDRPPILRAGAEMLMARGMSESVVGSPTAALSALTRASGLLEPSQHGPLLPDTPAALAALLAIHLGQFDVADSVLDGAIAARLGGRLAETRHSLLRAWTAMLRGAHRRAATVLREGAPEGIRLEPRDELLAAALRVGLARRDGDLRALHEAWLRARQAVVRHPVDLLALLPLGELAVGAARLGDHAWVAPHLAEAHDLLARLGHPSVWATPLTWQNLHAAIASAQPAEARQHAEALERMASHGPYPAALAGAARCWLEVMAGHIDDAAVAAATRALRGVGLGWEGSRLAGQAAIRTTDRKAMSALLALARGMHADAPEHAGASPAAGGPGAARGGLSDREREIATLLVASLTYRQIGERLFISAKTVEHHVARIRQRLGSAGRAELLDQLRLMVQEPGPALRDRPRDPGSAR